MGVKHICSGRLLEGAGAHVNLKGSVTHDGGPWFCAQRSECLRSSGPAGNGKSNPMARIWSIFTLLLSIAANAATVDSECAPEPVFSGDVCVYQANQVAEHSVVLVHGINGSAKFDWELQLSALAERYHVVAVDLPGFGSSSKGPGAYTPDNYAQVLAFVIERYVKGRRHSVIGHSMGAVVALRYAARYAGHDLERLVLVDSAGILHGVALSKAFVGSYISRNGSERFSEFAARMTGKLLEAFERLSLSPEDELPDEWTNDDSASATAMAVAATDMSHDLAIVDLPALIVWGARDDVAPLRTGKVLDARLSDSRLVVVPEAGHMPMRDQPARVNELLLRFLAGGDVSEDKSGPVNIHEGEPDRVGYCEGQRGLTFSGRYRRIELRNCDRVVLQNVRVDELLVFESRVHITESEILGDGVAMEVEGSEVEVTASRIAGRVGIVSARSRFDLAGVELIGGESAWYSPSVTNIVFSVSQISSPLTIGYQHGFLRLDGDRL